MSGVSTKTGLVTIRLPVEVLKKVKVIVQKRKDKGEKGLTVSSYLGRIIVVQVTRSR